VIGLIALNVLVWAAALAYLVLKPRIPRWHWGVAAGVVLAAVVVSAFSYRQSARPSKKDLFLKHYYAALDEKRRGDLEAAEKELETARTLQPGDPRVAQELQELSQQKPVDRREQRKEVRVDPSAAPPPQPASSSSSSAPNQTTATAQPPRPAGGQPGEKPKPAAHKPSPFEITDYVLDVAIEPAQHTLDATATIRIRSRGEETPRLDFSLNRQFHPSAAQVDGLTVPFTHTNDLLSLTPTRPFRAGAEATVTVKYRREGEAVLRESADLISSTCTYLRSETRWYPATGELDFRSPVKVRATVPKGYSVVSVGALEGIEKDATHATFTWHEPNFASMVSLAAAKYVQRSVPAGRPGGAGPPVKLTCYTFPQHKDRAPEFLKEAAGMLRFYQQRFGPYPYGKLAIVEIALFPGGYGTTSFIMLIDKSFAAKKLDREFVAHEIAHQWWGNSVFPQGLGAAWLTEAFANYSAWLYDAARAGNPRVLQKRVQRAIGEYFRAVQERGDQALAETDPYQPVGAVEQILYEKGAVVLHMLRQQIGDAAFFKTLRAFADRHRFGKAKIEDFRKVAEESSGQDLGWFFDQWLGRTGGLSLAYSFETVPDTPKLNKAVLRVAQKGAPYRAKMKVVLDVEGQVQTRTIEITEAKQEFTFPVRGKLTNVLFDPNNDYLMSVPQWIVAESPAPKRGG
jgi:aminopeptidase N